MWVAIKKGESKKRLKAIPRLKPREEKEKKMKQTNIGSAGVTLELTKEELGFIVYLNETSSKKLTKSERTFIQELEAIVKRMGEIEKIEKANR